MRINRMAKRRAKRTKRTTKKTTKRTKRKATRKNPVRKSPAGTRKSTAPKKYVPKVAIYVSRECPHSRALMSYLNRRGISHVTYDIDRDEEASKRLSKVYHSRSVPVTILNGKKKIVGFEQEMFDALFAL
jgi:glutaredoxin